MTMSNDGTPSPGSPRSDAIQAEISDSRWQGLYRVGGAAALIIAVITAIATAVFVIWPPPLEGSAIDWFTLFQRNWLLGLLGLDLLFLVVWVLQVPILLALYASLRRAGESSMALATAFAFVGVAVYLASNPAFEMLSLSDRYAAAATDAERATLLAAGEAVLASFQGTAFKVSYILASVAGMTIAAVILRSSIFSKATGYARLLASVLGLGLFVPVVGVPLALLSVVFEWIWFILIGRALLQRGRAVAKEEAAGS